MARALARRTDVERRPPNGYIRSCTFHYGYHEYESAFGFREMFRNPHGDTIDAEFVTMDRVRSEDFEPLMVHPVVFEWPGAKQFIVMRVRDVYATQRIGLETVVSIHGAVLGVFEYDDNGLTRQDAGARAQKLLTA